MSNLSSTHSDALVVFFFSRPLGEVVVVVVVVVVHGDGVSC